jgi:3-hydroxy-9,10-secoandrosta-1,3,5(10)-triene-9,17-dione monooxygenase reductase component
MSANAGTKGWLRDDGADPSSHAGASVSQIDADQLRHVLGHLPTGVTVITAHGPDGPAGMAANSVTSASLDPPLMLFCPALSSTTWPVIRDTGRFCINVMAQHHEQATRQFARRGAERFGDVAYRQRLTGPALDDAVAWIECSLRDEYDAGDHTIALADVLAIEAAGDELPLVFFRGRYGGFLARDR